MSTPFFHPRIREISEIAPGQISNGFGGSTTGEPGAPTPNGSTHSIGGVAIGNMIGSSTGVPYANYFLNHSSQNNMGGSINGPLRSAVAGNHHSHMPPKARMGRRVSDGGPYVAAYKKMFLEKRNLQLNQIQSNSNIEKLDSSSVNSMKLLMQERERKVSYGGLPGNTNREWQHFKNQVRKTEIQRYSKLLLSSIARYSSGDISCVRVTFHVFGCQLAGNLTLVLNS